MSLSGPSHHEHRSAVPLHHAAQQKLAELFQHQGSAPIEAQLRANGRIRIWSSAFPDGTPLVEDGVLTTATGRETRWMARCSCPEITPKVTIIGTYESARGVAGAMTTLTLRRDPCQEGPWIAPANKKGPKPARLEPLTGSARGVEGVNVRVRSRAFLASLRSTSGLWCSGVESHRTSTMKKAPPRRMRPRVTDELVDAYPVLVDAASQRRRRRR